MSSTTRDTFVLKTNLLQTTFIIKSTFWRNFSTFYVRIATKSRWTITDGGVIGWSTSCSNSTSTGNGTSIDTFVLDTGLFCRTVFRVSTALDTDFVGTDGSKRTLHVESAFRRGTNPVTVDFSITSEVRETRALSIMIDWFAKSVRSTSTVDRAWILTLFVDASFFKLTMKIIPASCHASIRFTNLTKWTCCIHFTIIVWNWITFHVWISQMVLRTFTSWSVLEWNTDSV